MSTQEEKFHAVAEKSRVQAKAYLSKGNVARAFSHFLVALKLEPQCIVDVVDDFVYSLREVGLQLETEKRYDELFNCYRQALDASPACYQIHNNFGAHLFRLSQYEEASIYFLSALKLNSDFFPAKDNLENVSNILVERWHFSMLNDVSRNMAFRSAIHRAVKAGYRQVLDIGSGTGILSMYAAEAGATYIHACEVSKVMHTVSCHVLEANKLESRVQLLNCHSSELSIPRDLPQRVQLVITETLDCGLLGENILSTLSHAWNHLLVPSSSDSHTSPTSKVIPSKATVKACLIECEYIRKQNRVLVSKVGTLELAPLKYIVIDEDDPYLSEKLDRLPGGYRYLSEPVNVLEIDFNDPKEIDKYINGHSETVAATASLNGTVDAVVAWFDLHLDDIDVISTRTRSCWEQAVYSNSQCSEADINANSNVGIEVKVNENYMQLSFTQNDEMATKNSPPGFEFLKCSRLDLQRINDKWYWTLLRKCLKLEVKPNTNVMDISSIPFGGLMAMQLGAENVILSKSCKFDLALEIASFNCLNLSHIHKRETDEVYECDILIVDVVESNGLLKQNILDDIAVWSHLHLKPDGLIIPSSVIVHAVAVESLELVEMNRLVDDKRVGNFVVADVINVFKVAVHCDIQMSTTSYRELIEPIEVLNLPLDTAKDKMFTVLEVTNKLEVEILSSGTVHGIFVWFTLQLNDTVKVDTSDPNSSWRQSCFILKEPLPVEARAKVELGVNCKNSCLDVHLTGL